MDKKIGKKRKKISKHLLKSIIIASIFIVLLIAVIFLVTNKNFKSYVGEAAQALQGGIQKIIEEGKIKEHHTKTQRMLQEGEGTADEQDKEYFKANKKDTYKKIDKKLLDELENKKRIRVVLHLKEKTDENSFSKLLKTLEQGDSDIDDDFRLRYNFDNLNLLIGYADIDAINKLEDDPNIDLIEDEPTLYTQRVFSQNFMNITPIHSMTVNTSPVNGSGFNICIIDSGVDYNHADFDCVVNMSDYNDSLRGCLVVAKDYIDDDDNPMDLDGHGTHIAGILHNVSPESNIIIMRVCNGGSCQMGDHIQGIRWCDNNRQTYNISIMSVSIASSAQYVPNCTSINSAYDPDYISAYNHGIFMAYATGNDASTTGIGYPACKYYTTSVGATYKNNEIRTSSNRIPGQGVPDIWAVGTAVTSSCLGGGLCDKTGSSIATPFIAASAALLRHYYSLANQTKTPAEIRQLFVQNSDNATDYTYNYARLNLKKVFDCKDKDIDGFNESGYNCGPVDCNGTNSSIYPGAAELCNNIDDDCDILIDEDFDLDSDTYTSCGSKTDNPSYYPGTADCNNTNNQIYPGAAELCNNKDDNCNSQIDEIFDNDGDNLTICGSKTNNINYYPGIPDCNDTNYLIYPGALEIPFNDIDENCDGVNCDFIDMYETSFNAGNYEVSNNARVALSSIQNQILIVDALKFTTDWILGKDIYDRASGASYQISIKPQLGGLTVIGWYYANPTGKFALYKGSYQNMAHGIYIIPNSVFKIVENGLLKDIIKPYGGKVLLDKWYDFKISLKPSGGADYYYRERGKEWEKMSCSKCVNPTATNLITGVNSQGKTRYIDDWIVGTDKCNCIDNDEDGFGTGADLSGCISALVEDCDNNDNTIYPGANEILNSGTDEDCDGKDLTGTCDFADTFNSYFNSDKYEVASNSGVAMPPMVGNSALLISGNLKFLNDWILGKTTYDRNDIAFQISVKPEVGALTVIGWYPPNPTGKFALYKGYYKNVVHGIYLVPNSVVKIVENGVFVKQAIFKPVNDGKLIIGTWYDFKIIIKSDGSAEYWYKKSSDSTWQQMICTYCSTSTESVLIPGVNSHGKTRYVDNWIVGPDDCLI